MASVNPLDVTSAQGLHGLEMLVVEVDKLVSLPDIYYRLEEAIVDPASSIDMIAELLRSDPDLCARMLRLANSAFYSFPTSIETIERAVSTVGLRQIRELVLITSVVKAFADIPSECIDMKTFWEHSVAVAIMARELGIQGKIPGAGGFYIPGLLHDIGRLVMYLKLPGLMVELLQQRQTSGQALYLLERDILDYSHAEIGGRLLEYWKLPQSIWEPVVTHHEPRKGGEYSLAACTIHIADSWVNNNYLGSNGCGFEISNPAEALQRIDVDLEEVDRVGALAAEQTSAVVRRFMGN